MRTPPHNRYEQPALSLELLKLRPQPLLIHCPDFIPPRFRRFPAVINIQDLAFLKFPETTLLTPESNRYYGQVEWAARDAEAIIALSHSARDDIVSLLGAKASKVYVIPAAADARFLPPDDLKQAQEEAARNFGLPGPLEGGYILFVSTIEPRKNLVTLLEAYREILDSGRVSPEPALAVVGREGWLFEQTYQRIEELRLKERIRLIGAISTEKLAALYQGARAFALPSLYEGFGLPALEAMACGAPTLVSNTGSLPEVVADAGILLDPHDPSAWAAALERVLSDPREEARLREAGPLRAEQFSWHKAAVQTWELYEKVAKHKW
jgi:glycosyltransferase involved in cell wall biosynthesis